MKTAIKSALTAVRRAAAWYQMRSLEINLHGAVESLPYIRDPDTYAAMQVAIRAMSKELCRARSHYTSFLPPGRRIVWESA